MAQFRDINPTANTLLMSRCIATGTQVEGMDQPRGAIEARLPESATIEAWPTDANAQAWRIEVPHAKIDAFAFLNAIEDSGIVSNDESNTFSTGQRQGIDGDCRWTSVWKFSVPSHCPSKSFTRQFIETLAEIFSPHDVVAVPVLLDAVQCKQERCYSGVGFGSALISFSRICSLSTMPTSVWNDFLESRARLSIKKIAVAAPSDLLMPSVVVSSLGNFDLNWPKLKADPSTFSIFSTPVHPSVPHLVLWRVKNKRVLTICRNTLNTQSPSDDAIIECWRTV